MPTRTELESDLVSALERVERLKTQIAATPPQIIKLTNIFGDRFLIAQPDSQGRLLVRLDDVPGRLFSKEQVAELRVWLNYHFPANA